MDERRALDRRLAQLRECLERTEERLRTVRKRDRLAILIGTSMSAGAAVLAGVPGLTGMFIVDGWQLTCALTAALSGTASVVAGVQQTLGNSDRIIEAATALAKLRDLEFDWRMGRIGVEQADVEYQALAEQFPELVPLPDLGSPALRARPA